MPERTDAVRYDVDLVREEARMLGGDMGGSRRGPRARAGFAPIELAIVVAILAILACLSLPRMARAGGNPWEEDAIATLRSIASAQAQVQSLGAIDSDGDGVGEYGSFGELSGATPVRVSVLGTPAPGVIGLDELDPPLIARSFGRVTLWSTVRHRGYLYKIFLPAYGPQPYAFCEEPLGGFTAGPFPSPDNGALYWCVYAWPLEWGSTGRRAFFLNDEAAILASPNQGAGSAPIYSGMDVTRHPAFDAAYVEPHMASGAAIDGMGTDGNRWIEVE